MNLTNIFLKRCKFRYFFSLDEVYEDYIYYIMCF